MTSTSHQHRQEQPAGPPLPGGPAYLVIGKLRRPHGVRGELYMEVLTDFPERIQPGCMVYAGQEHHPVKVLQRRNHQDGLLITLEGINNPESAGLYRNCLLFVRVENSVPLPEGEYYHHQLLGLAAVTESGEVLGKVSEILETGVHDVLLLHQPDGKELLLPYIDTVVLEVHLATGKLLVRPLPGMLNEA